MTAPRVSEEEAKLIASSCEQASPLVPGNLPRIHIGSAAFLLRRLLSERAALEARLAEAERLAAAVLNERESRRVGGADDCYTDNARSRGREHRATEALLLTLRREAGEEGE